MRNLWCKLWNWFLNTVNDIGDTVAYNLRNMGTIAADLLSTVAAGVGDAIGSIFGGSNLLVWAVAAVFAYAVITHDSDEDRDPDTPGGNKNGLS